MSSTELAQEASAASASKQQRLHLPAIAGVGETWCVRAGIALIVLVAALSASPVAAQSPLDPGARVFTLAGGGNRHKQAGLPAGRLSLLNSLVGMPLAALADGSVVVVDDLGRPGLVGLDGRVRPLPPVMESRRTLEVRYLAAASDGSLLAVGFSRYWDDLARRRCRGLARS